MNRSTHQPTATTISPMTLGNVAVDTRGHIVHLDADGHRDFSPATRRRVQYATAIVVAVLVAACLYSVAAAAGIVPAAPWSPIGIGQDTPPLDVPDSRLPSPGGERVAI